MIHVLVDSKSHQAIRHLGSESKHYPDVANAGHWRGRRLTGFEADLRDRGMDLVLDDLSDDSLTDATVVMITGRSNRIPFSDAELEALSVYHQQGGAIFLMANHAGFVMPQNQVATVLGLGVEFQEVTRTDRRPRLVERPMHETSRGCPEGLRIRTSCQMTVGRDFVTTVEDEDGAIGSLAAAGDGAASGGRVMVATSGGHIASIDDSETDMYSSANNAKWTMNIIEWLQG